MKDMPENFFNDFNVSRGLYISSYQVVSPYKVFNLLAVANMSEKNTSRFMGGCTMPPFGLPRKAPSTHLKIKKL